MYFGNSTQSRIPDLADGMNCHEVRLLKDTAATTGDNVPSLNDVKASVAERKGKSSIASSWQLKYN